MTPNKLPPLPEPIYSDDDLRVIVQDWDESNFDQMVSIVLARECLCHREALRQSQSLPAGAVAGLVGKWREEAEKLRKGGGRAQRRGDLADADVAFTAAQDACAYADELEQALQADAREKGEAAPGEVETVIGRLYAAARHVDHAREKLPDAFNHQEHNDILDAIALIRRLATQPAQASEPLDFPQELLDRVETLRKKAAANEGKPEVAAAAHASEPQGKFRAALLWLLWCHQGGSSEVGQPIRAMLGIGPHDCMTDEQVAEAKTYATHPQPVTPAGGEVARIDRDLVLARARQRAIEISAKALVRRLEEVHADPKYIAVWAVAQNHLGPYAGPKYEVELENLTGILTRRQARGDGHE